MSQTEQPTAARLERAEPRPSQSDGARKRAAVEMISSHGPSLKRTARRYSLDAEDAEDAYQRALEITLTKAPTTDPRDLIRWMHTVIKHEALAVRQGRERLLGRRAHRGSDGEEGADPVSHLATPGDGPGEQAERREAIARSREALRTLKPAELRALSLLAEGYSYAEISELTGFSRTKVNRVLSEGRERFRSVISSSEDGSRCRKLGPLLSAFCDGEASPGEVEVVREHLRACARCRATMRAYRSAPRIVVGLIPSLPASRSLLERAHDFLSNLEPRLAGGGGSSTAVQTVAAGGPKGVGLTALAKLLAVCGGVAVGGVACVTTGVLPAPSDLTANHAQKVTIERVAPAILETSPSAPAEHEPSRTTKSSSPPQPQPGSASEAQPADSESFEAEADPVEYVPAAPASTAAPVSEESAPAGPTSGSAAGEFGP